MSNISEIIQKHLSRHFEGKTVSVPQGANNVGKRIDSLNAQINKCQCEVVTKIGAFEFNGASMDKIKNPFANKKVLLQSNASLNWRTVDNSLSIEVIL